MTISATSGWVDRTVNCIVTPSASANLERTKISAPPRNIPENNKNKQRKLIFVVGEANVNKKEY